MTKTSQRRMTKSPLAIAQAALKAGHCALGEYSSRFSKKKYTQPQLFAILVLKAFFRTDYRGISDLLNDLKDLRKVLGLKEVPHYSTLAYAEKRLLKKGLLTYSNELSLNEQGELDFFEVNPGRL